MSNSKENKIVVLSTLHHFHKQDDFYTLDDIEEIMDNIEPDIICAELTEEELKMKKEQKVKLEYPDCIIPYAEDKDIEIIPMEPEEPDYSELVNTRIHTEKKLKEDEPERYETFELFVREWFTILRDEWTGYKEVNNELNDKFCELKHNFQGELFGKKNKKMWESWNQHFLETIERVDSENEGKTILVTVGFEHSYWLRKRLDTVLPQNV